MALQEIISEKVGKPEHAKPKLPNITNEEAIQAQNKLNEQLNRFDISTNALPSNEGKVLTILVHGYMASKWLWIDPYFGTFGWLRDYRNDPKPRSYGWHQTPPPGHMYMPFDVSVSPLEFPEGLFNTLMRQNNEVLTFSQKDPSGDIDFSAKELALILEGITKIFGNRRIVLVGHSRGGICIRRYLDLKSDNNIEKIISLSSPHYGTSFSNIKIIKQPALTILNDASVKKVWDASGMRYVRDMTYEQMAPESEYLKELNDIEKNPQIEYIAVGGTSPIYAHIYTWSIARKHKRNLWREIFPISSSKLTNKSSKEKSRKNYHWIAKPKKMITIFQPSLLPEFISGDGIVSLQSAILKEATRKYKIDANHEEIAVCEDTKKLILKELKISQKKG
ncbi:MAG: esterase/lipase family protein [Candidatus Thorarchaeota archaeon]